MKGERANDVCGFVYFMQCEATTRIKIGWSADVPRRLQDLNGQSPTRIALLCAKPADRREESALHRRFANWRVRGITSREWFYLSGDLRELIESLGGKPAGQAVLTEQELRRDATRVLEQIEAVELLVGDILEIADPNHHHRDYRHERFGSVALSGGLLRDVGRAREILRELLSEVRDERRNRLRGLIRLGVEREVAASSELLDVIRHPMPPPHVPASTLTT